MSDHPISYMIHYTVNGVAFPTFTPAYELFLNYDGPATLEQVTTKMIVRK